MKKHILFATALFAGSISFAQQKEKAPPPPPPPPLEAKELPPPPPPAPPETVLNKIEPADYSSFLDRNKEVKSIEWLKDQKVSILLKSGKKEVYDLKKNEEVKKLENKYGVLPEAPPPPPAPKITKQQ